jgi:hypothetical protein
MRVSFFARSFNTDSEIRNPGKICQKNQRQKLATEAYCCQPSPKLLRSVSSRVGFKECSEDPAVLASGGGICVVAMGCI